MHKLTKNLTLRFNNVLYLIDKNDRTKPLKGNRFAALNVRTDGSKSAMTNSRCRIPRSIKTTM